MADIKANLIDETPVIKSSVIDWKGKDGYTPIKGVDYFTKEDIEEITDPLNEAINAKADQTELNDVKESIHQLDETKVGYSEIVNGQLLMYSDDSKEHLLATMDLPSGGGSVDDVKINGTSVVTDGVANVPLASSQNAGVGKTSVNTGINIVGEYLVVQQADKGNIDGRNTYYKPITPNGLDYAVKQAMCDGKGAEWSETEKADGRTRLGIITLTQEEYNLIENPSANTIYIII